MPVKEEFARRVIQIMKDAGTEAGQVMVLGAIDLAWAKGNGERPDLEAGLEYAGAQQWIENAGSAAVRLTVQGAQA